MKHISYVSSGIVYTISGVFGVAILFALKVGWDAMPPFFRSFWGEVVFMCLSVAMVSVFFALAAMFVLKIIAQAKIDFHGIKEPRKLPVKREAH